ncbi:MULTISPECIES: hypothetical protein [unclassified Streptomyces]|uniref:restriction system modified-DNA reader domain-containing protein n=1 Tax=unclassified Streptomyces TaxID=2593676 RepID=UPI002E153D60|nr:hypothetical protein OG452_07095 [Streptomyces sp. NBC_01197]WSS52207.1 hypothetical protein OG708_28395 [Streptomyces sp. NBC_01180]
MSEPTHTLHVDTEVFAKLQSLAEPFVDTPNSTLRRLLGLTPAPAEGRTAFPSPLKQKHSPRDPSQTLAPLIEDGRLHVGQRLVWHRRNLGRMHQVIVVEGGGLRLDDGTVHYTPSSAATALAGNQQNGWKVFATEAGIFLKDLR